MDASLLDWLESLQLSCPILCIERDFASGYLFAEILWRLAVFKDINTFQKSSGEASQVQNFIALKRELGKISIKLTAAQMHSIVQGKPGAASRLLRQIMEATNKHTKGQKLSNASQSASLGLGKAAGKPSGDDKQKRSKVSSGTSSAARLPAPAPQSDTGNSSVEGSECLSRSRSAASKLKGGGTGGPLAHCAASERAEVLESIDNFEMILQRQGVQINETAFDSSKSIAACGDVEQALHQMYRKLPSLQSQREFNSRLMTRLHSIRQAQESSCHERSRLRQRLMIEQAQRCRELLDAQFTASVAAGTQKRSAQSSELVSVVTRARKYERVIRCNIEVNKKLWDEQEKKRLAVQQRHSQLTATTRRVLTEAALQEQARICRSVHTVRRALKRSRLIGECEALAEQIVDLVIEAGKYKEKFDCQIIPRRVWRSWLTRFVLSEDATDSVTSTEIQEGSAPSSGIILHIPATPPAVSVSFWRQDSQPVPLPASLLNEFREYFHAEGSWSTSQEDLSLPEVASLPRLGGFLASVLKSQDRPETAAAVEASDTSLKTLDRSLERGGNFGGLAHGAAEAANTVEGSVQEPQLELLGEMVRCLLEHTVHVSRPARLHEPPGALLRIIMTGKPGSGTETLANQLATRYKLKVLTLEGIVQEFLQETASAVTEQMGACSLGERAKIGEDTDENEIKSVLGAPSTAAPYESGASVLKDLGAQAVQQLMRGCPLPDELAVRLIVAKLQELFPKGGSKKSKGSKESPAERVGPSRKSGVGNEGPLCGWILLGFPTTALQYSILEEQLSGFVALERRAPKKLDVLKGVSALLVQMPKEEEVQPGLEEGCADAHFLLDLPMQEVIFRGMAAEEGPANCSTTFQIVDEAEVAHREKEKEDSVVSLLDLAFAFETHQGFVEEFVSSFGTQIEALLALKLKALKANQHDGTADAVANAEAEPGAVAAHPAATTAESLPQSPPSAPIGTSAGQEEIAAEEAPEDAHPLSQIDPTEDLGENIPSAASAAMIRATRLCGGPFACPSCALCLSVHHWCMRASLSLALCVIAAFVQAFRWTQLFEDHLRASQVSLQLHFASFLNTTDWAGDALDQYLLQYSETLHTLGTSIQLQQIKEELHLRVDDLCEGLWQREESERQKGCTEKRQLMDAGWAEAFGELLAAQLSRIIEIEIARYWALDEFVTDFFYSLMGLPLPDRQQQHQTEAEPLLSSLKEIAISDVHAALPAICGKDPLAAPPPKAWKQHPFESLEAAATKALLSLEMSSSPPAAAAHPTDEKKKQKPRESSGSAAASRRPEGPSRTESSQGLSFEHQALSLLRVQLQQQLLYRLRKNCLWGATVLLRLGASVTALSLRFEEWLVALSLARQEAVGILSNKLKEAIENESPVSEEIRLKGVQLFMKRVECTTQSEGSSSRRASRVTCSSAASSAAVTAVRLPAAASPGVDANAALVRQLISDCHSASAGRLLMPTICLEKSSQFLPPLRLPGGSVDCVEFLFALALGGMKRAAALQPDHLQTSSKCLLDLRVTAEEFAQICNGNWLPAAASTVDFPPLQLQRQPDQQHHPHSHQQDLQQQDLRQRELKLLPRLLFDIVAAFDAAVPSSQQQQQTLKELVLWQCTETPNPARAPPEDAGHSFLETTQLLQESDSVEQDEERLQPRVALRKLLGYLCLSSEPSKAIRKLLLCLARDVCDSSVKRTAGGSEEEGLKDPWAPLEEVFALCCGLGFRGAPWGPPPVTLLPFADFVTAATAEQLLLPQQQTPASASGTLQSDECPPRPQHHRVLLLEPFLKSRLFRRVVRACGGVYVDSGLDRFVSSLAAIGEAAVLPHM
ncbi:hypothetical protein cyc_02492 [Cyclospora cayetanensis]|uniref:Uncharacterized protein n=1 Tax=Cyclospora cayetanensis TaxID=88456 RepID=A0A1D3D409_9EIME|nr:hypothetical protein cyc_02492 [Cyclospora cayetanensis]